MIQNLAGFYNAKLKKHQQGWLPWELGASSIGAAVHHFVPFTIQYTHFIEMLTGSKPCVQVHGKLLRGKFSATDRMMSFLWICMLTCHRVLGHPRRMWKSRVWSTNVNVTCRAWPLPVGFAYPHPVRNHFTLGLHWRYNDQGGVSNHQPHGCLLKGLFGRISKKTSKLRVTGLCAGNSPGPVNSPHKGPVTRKMFPFDDVIMILHSNVSHRQWTASNHPRCNPLLHHTGKILLQHCSYLGRQCFWCDSPDIRLNSLAPGRPGCHFKTAFFNLALLIDIFTSSNDNPLRWMPWDLIDDKSTLVQVMAWCRQATSHYLSQCWHSSMSPYGVTRPQ